LPDSNGVSREEASLGNGEDVDLGSGLMDLALVIEPDI